MGARVTELRLLKRVQYTAIICKKSDWLQIFYLYEPFRDASRYWS